MCSVTKNEIEIGGKFPNARTIDSMEHEGKVPGKNRHRMRATSPISSVALG